MNLANELAETNALLRAAASKPVEKSEAPPPGRRQPEPLRASEMLVSIREIGSILQENFKPVPEKFWEQHEDKSRTVTCLCSEETTIPFGGLHHCGCDRIFWNGQTLKAAPPAPEDDVQVCDLCCEEVRSSQGAAVLIDGIDGFACDGCR